ncbi:integral membrane protein [Hypomontagnella submonticulosa]|nr:integral membrane protein [Hypomontagnella submonticulosa]
MTFLGSRPRRHSFTALSSTENHNGRDRPSSFDGRDDDRDSQNTVVDEGNARDIEEGEPFLEKGIGNQTVRNSTRSGFGWAVFWIVVNTLATIGIVFTNKAIFSDPSLKLVQLTFAAFHFFMTWLLLFMLSRPQFAYFSPRRIPLREIIPLSVAMSLNVILPNLSLAFSTVTFYQVARILLTPTVATMDFVLYKSILPRNAILALVPACLGVAMVSYYDSLPTIDANIKTTSNLGVLFAFSGIFASSLYTVWIKSYQRKLQVSSMQLLFSQAPVSAFLLLYAIPFIDTFPTWTEVPMTRWLMILMSGVFAALINLSQFFIVGQTGPVSSTVVGHLKTCLIVALGWATSGRSVGDKSVIGVLIAVGGIITYSIVMLRYVTRRHGQD